MPRKFPPTHHLLLGFMVAAVLIALAIFLWPKAVVSNSSNALISFASCLKEKDVIMYGNDTCINCQNQKKMFGNAFDLVHYVNCDFHKQECESQRITAYPVWIQGEYALIGLQSLEQLSEFSGCASPVPLGAQQL